jgi:ribosomal protein S18 acetylase RimI-like enzyme
MPFFSRGFADTSDIPLLIDWVRAIRSPERVTDYPSVIDLPQLLALPQNQSTLRLWFTETNDLLGFAFVDVFHTLRFELDWTQVPPELEAEVVAWGESCHTPESTLLSASKLYATTHEVDSVRPSFLERHDFASVADTILHLERSLALPTNPPRLAPEFVIRPVEGEQEAAELAQLHCDAFGTPHMTTERRVAMMRTANYHPDLDLVVVTTEGVYAAYGRASLCPEENALTGRNECYADLFATHPAYRGRGLARALVVTLVHLLQQQGYTTAKLTTSSENVAMKQVALSEGFQLASETRRFARLSN